MQSDDTGVPKEIEFKLAIIVEPDGDVFHSYCPALKGLHSCGETHEEALGNAKDAAIAYLRSLIKRGDPIPIGVVPQRRKTQWPLLPTLQRQQREHVENLLLAMA